MSEGEQVETREHRIVQKSPQELATQTLSVAYVDFNKEAVVDAENLAKRYKEFRGQVQTLLASGVDDETLGSELKKLYGQASQLGIYIPTVGENREANIQKAKEGLIGFGYSKEEAQRKTVGILERNGFLRELRFRRKWDEETYLETFQDFDQRHPPCPEENEAVDNLKNKTFVLRRLTPEQRQKLQEEFPGGNFLYHGAQVEQVIAILESGKLLNFKAIHEAEEAKAEIEERKVQTQKRNSGYEGISWSFNQVDALPGDRYHLAGFIGSPNLVLSPDQQLAIPSRPAPFELIQVDKNLETKRYYQLKTQLELAQAFSVGESNSILSNIICLELFKENEAKGEKSIFDSSLLLDFTGKYSDDQIQEQIKDKYHEGPKGTVEFSPDLLQQTDNEVPVAAVWFQYLIDSGKIVSLPGFESARTVREVTAKVNQDNFKILTAELKREMEALNEEMEQLENNLMGISVDIENLYFVTSEKDLPRWRRVIARCQKQPRGILVYDHMAVRLENFASEHRGDNIALTDQFRLGIEPDSDNGWIDWEKQILGEEVTPDKRAGGRHQVIAEKYLTKSKTVKKDPSGNLFIS